MTNPRIKTKEKCQGNKKIKDIPKEVSTKVEFAQNLEISKVIRNIKMMESKIKKDQVSNKIKILDSKNRTLITNFKDTILSMETLKDMIKMPISMIEDTIKTNIKMSKMASFNLHKENIIKIINSRIIKSTRKMKMMKTIMLHKESDFKKDHIINMHHM